MQPNQQKLISAAPALRKALLGWFMKHQRPMPWRQKISAYRTVVSELMCQQTQIATATPYFERWVARWPDFKALAKASESDVLKLWAGLGYYSRARNLLRLAKEVALLKETPRTAEAWQQYPGVGPYTAAAIASIAFREPVAVVDGNVIRVLARLTGHRALMKSGVTAARYFTPLANQLVAAQSPGDFNQAMMELGATVCRKASPHCSACPLSRWCIAKAQKTTALIPKFETKKRTIQQVHRALIMKDRKILLHRQDSQARRLAGVAEIPDIQSLNIKTKTAPVFVRRRTIGQVTYEENLIVLKLNKSVQQSIHRSAQCEWVDVDQLADAAVSGPHRRWLAEWLSLSDQPKRGRRT
jgi:A/G-specific adenine glycosylase